MQLELKKKKMKNEKYTDWRLFLSEEFYFS